jgi:hypothetical protein
LTEVAITEVARYRAAWRDLRLRRTLAAALILGFIPASLTLARLVPWGGHVRLVWLLSIIPAVLWLMRFRCPRCGEPFLQRGRNRLLLSRACLSCGIRVGERPPD